MDSTWGQKLVGSSQQHLQHLQQHPIFKGGVEYLSAISPAQWCQIFYLLAAVCVLIVAATPAEARTLLMDYGARKASSSQNGTQNQQPVVSGPGEQGREGQQKQGGADETERKKEQQARRANPFLSLIAFLTSYGQVPHSWFSAFYFVSVASSIFWATQYYLLQLYPTGLNLNTGSNNGGSILHAIATKQVASTTTSSSSGVTITQGQLLLAWTTMFLQGSRRIYEHLTIIKASKKSTMWFVHWVLGLGYYVVTNVAVWVEGSGTILNTPSPLTLSKPLSSLFQDPESAIKLIIAIPLFLLAWTNQYKTHSHLASLVKYSLPTKSLFKYLVCPHYTCECLLYLSIAIIASPQGQYFNKTLLCGLVFVVVNLGVTASGTRKWYVTKLGEEAVKGKWNMIPLIF